MPDIPGHDERLLGSDPRDAVADAESALWGVVRLLQELPCGVELPVDGLASMLSLIHDRLDPAARCLQHYTPKR